MKQNTSINIIVQKYTKVDTNFSNAFWLHRLSKKNIEYDYEYKWNVFIVNVLVNRPRWTNKFGRMLGDKLERKTATHEKIKKKKWKRRAGYFYHLMLWSDIGDLLSW